MCSPLSGEADQRCSWRVIRLMTQTGLLGRLPPQMTDGWPLHWQQRPMDACWQLHCDGISRRYIPAFYDNRHNASLSNELAVRIATEHCRG